MRSVGPALLALLALGGCPKPTPAPKKVQPKPLTPLTPGEIQTSVTGAARLNRHCRQREAPTGLYVIRLMLDPRGAVSEATPRQAPSRAEDPAIYAGVPRYIDAGAEPDNAVTRCLTEALGKLRLRPFSGPAVGFDYPVVVERAPPSEAPSPHRACRDDSECVLVPLRRRPCACPRCPCPRCPTGPTWRRATSKKTLADQHDRWRKDWRRCRRRRRRVMRSSVGPRHCEPCAAVPRLGHRALCIDGQCSVR